MPSMSNQMITDILKTLSYSSIFYDFAMLVYLYLLLKPAR